MRVIVTVSTQEDATAPMVTRETFTIESWQKDVDLDDIGGYIMDAVRHHADP